jgi:hypothetical protein
MGLPNGEIDFTQRREGMEGAKNPAKPEERGGSHKDTKMSRCAAGLALHLRVFV